MRTHAGLRASCSLSTLGAHGLGGRLSSFGDGETGQARGSSRRPACLACAGLRAGVVEEAQQRTRDASTRIRDACTRRRVPRLPQAGCLVSRAGPRAGDACPR
jgi:hypothetical protein